MRKGCNMVITKIPVGMDEKNNLIDLNLPMANRHGLIAGATGTGKTVTLQKIAEQFSRAGISVFSADVKGDFSGIAYPADDNPKVNARLKELHIKDFSPKGCPVVLWDINGMQGHPLRTTISEMGPVLLARLLNLNDVQEGVLNATFKIADDQGLLLLDLKDLQSLLTWVKENAPQLQGEYGNITGSTIGAIQRGLLTLSQSGADKFFGEPAFDIKNLLQKDPSGQGIINILDATQLINNGVLYSTFLLWLLSELFEKMPEVGDVDKPRLVFFFDEAHLLFDTAPKSLLEKVEQLVRLIRSKGIGVYFVTQNTMDIPESVLGQLGNRVQHALRAFTPKDQKSVKAAAQTFRKNINLPIEEVITQMGVGEALVSFLDDKGTPAVVDKVKIIPPESRIGQLTDAERQNLIAKSPFYGMYEKAIDRESAYEVLNERANHQKEAIAETVSGQDANRRSPGRPKQSVTEAIVVSTARSFGTQIGRQIIRGILGSIFKAK